MYWQLFKSTASLAGMVMCLFGVIAHDFAQATFFLGLVILYRVFDLPSKKRSD